MNDDIAALFDFPPGHVLSDLFRGAGHVHRLPGVIDRCLADVDCPRIEGDCHPSVELEGAVVVSKGSRLGRNVTVQGPCYIGPGARISAGANIRPGSWIGANVEIGRGSEVKRAICLDDAKIASAAFVGDSILGFGARVGSGAIFANRRFDQRHVTLRGDDGTRYSTEQPFFGAILGDYVRIGANAVLCPGIVVGAYSWIGPGVVLSANVPSARSVFVRQDLVVTPIAPRRLSRDAVPNPG